VLRANDGYSFLVPFSTRQTPWLRRASRRVVVVLASTLLCGVLLSPAASAAVLPPTNNPLPGSTFQGADGNQVDAAPNIDWQGMQGAGRVGHSPDPNAADSAFANSKENEPGNWNLTTVAGGVTPGKSNILDAWSAYEVRGTDAFIYLAFTRAESSGTTFLSFELNHDSRLWNNGAVGHVDDRSDIGVREDRTARRCHDSDAERGRPGRRQRGLHCRSFAGFLLWKRSG
jgi:hypothetical protein